MKPVYQWGKGNFIISVFNENGISLQLRRTYKQGTKFVHRDINFKKHELKDLYEAFHGILVFFDGIRSRTDRKVLVDERYRPLCIPIEIEQGCKNHCKHYNEGRCMMRVKLKDLVISSPTQKDGTLDVISIYCPLYISNMKVDETIKEIPQ